MIHMHHIIAHLQLVDLFERNDGLTAASILRAKCHAVISLKYLVIGIAAYLRTMVDKSLMQSMIYCHKLYARLFIIKNGFQAVCLFGLICQYIDAITIFGALLQVVNE